MSTVLGASERVTTNLEIKTTGVKIDEEWMQHCIDSGRDSAFKSGALESEF